mgnify:CR=1 FL=1
MVEHRNLPAELYRRSRHQRLALRDAGAVDQRPEQPGTAIGRGGASDPQRDVPDPGVQDRAQDSLLSRLQHLLHIRKKCPEIGWGTWKIVETGSPHVLAMQYEWREDSIVIVHNFAGQPLEISLRVAGERLVDLRVQTESIAKARERGLQVSEQMSDQEVWALIFEAGFSTLPFFAVPPVLAAMSS